MMRLADGEKIDVTLSNHSGYADTLEKLAARTPQAAGQRNPFVVERPPSSAH